MSLQFIFGNSGAGKSRYLYEQIVKESMEHPQTNYVVLVPEQFTMQTQRDLCAAHPRHGIMNIDVLSFVRLSHRVFEEVGKEVRRILDDEGKSLILRKIAGKYEDELKVLRGNLKKAGYISEVKSVISGFTQYGIGFGELDEFLETLEPESYLYYKLSDIRKVYEGFEDYLADKYITKEELLDVLSQVVPDSALLKDSVVVLDGFTGFTPVQNKLLGELMKVCKKVMVTVVMDAREDPFTYMHPYQLFAISRQRSPFIYMGNRCGGLRGIRSWAFSNPNCSGIRAGNLCGIRRKPGKSPNKRNPSQTQGPAGKKSPGQAQGLVGRRSPGQAQGFVRGKKQPSACMPRAARGRKQNMWRPGCGAWCAGRACATGIWRSLPVT